MTDAERELLIERAQLRLSLARGKRARARAWDELQALIKGRSAEQVERMEREKGLCHRNP